MGSSPGSPFGLEDKAPEPLGCFEIFEDFWGFIDSPHSHKQETRCLDTIHSCYFFLSLVATSLISRKIVGKGRSAREINWLCEIWGDDGQMSSSLTAIHGQCHNVSSLGEREWVGGCAIGD